MKVLCVCKHGQVRSTTMAFTIATLCDITTRVVGLLSDYIGEIQRYMIWADKIVICCKPEIDQKLSDLEPPHDVCSEERRTELFYLLERYKNKIVVCEDIGLDVWKTPYHPDLIHVCKNWVLKNKGLFVKS